MMSDSSSCGLSDLDDIDDLEMIMQQVHAEQEQEEEVERVRHRNYIYRERLDAEELFEWRDYFSLIVCTGNGEIAQKHGMGNLLEDCMGKKLDDDVEKDIEDCSNNVTEKSVRWNNHMPNNVEVRFLRSFDGSW
ncbi:hypothetical protein Tco_1576327 [Tanacetum coccineum]